MTAALVQQVCRAGTLESLLHVCINNTLNLALSELCI